MSKPKIGIIIATTREGRFGDKPAQWIHALAARREDADFEIVDLRDYGLPLFDEPRSPAYGPSDKPAVKRWQAKLAGLDGFLFVTAEYNRSIPAALKNALDYAYAEWNRKPAAFVGYGPIGASRAVEHLRNIAVELQMAPTRTGVHITMEPYLAVLKGEKALGDFEHLNSGAEATLNELAWWTKALKAAREATDPRPSRPKGPSAGVVPGAGHRICMGRARGCNHGLHRLRSVGGTYLCSFPPPLPLLPPLEPLPLPPPLEPPPLPPSLEPPPPFDPPPLEPSPSLRFSEAPPDDSATLRAFLPRRSRICLNLLVTVSTMPCGDGPKTSLMSPPSGHHRRAAATRRRVWPR